MTGDVVADHLEHLRGARYSESTLRERARVLGTIGGDLLTLDRERTQSWWASRQLVDDGRPRSGSSLSQEASHLRRFCRWAMQRGLVDYNAADWLPDVSYERHMTPPITEDELGRVLAGSTGRARRMIALAALAGLRPAEIGVLRWPDVGTASLTVRVPGGPSGRAVAITPRLLLELGEPSPGYVVGQRMSGNAVSRAISRQLDALGMDCSANNLRARHQARVRAAVLEATAGVGAAT